MAEEFDPRLNIDYAKQRNILIDKFYFLNYSDKVYC